MTRATRIEPLPNHQGKYSIGADGVVYGHRYARHALKTARAMTPLRVNSGYLTVCIDGKRRLVHRLVLETFVGPCPEKMEAAHLNGNKSDNRLENLVWKTHVANCADRTRHGTQPHGERQWLAKLTDESAAEALVLLSKGCGPNAVARRYGVAHSTIQRLRDGVTWKHLGGRRPELPSD